MRIVGVVAIALLLAGCAGPSGPPTVPATAPTTAAADLRGTWRGTWGGAPLTLLVTDQTDSAPYSGLFFGPWLVSGRRYPGVSGTMTYTDRGAAISVRFDGWIRADRPLMLLIASAPLDGPQQLTLKATGAASLTGDGESDFRWGPRGAIELTRAK